MSGTRAPTATDCCAGMASEIAGAWFGSGSSVMSAALPLGVEVVRRQGSLALHPLCGGIPPAVAWESLELLVSEVQPALA